MNDNTIAIVTIVSNARNQYMALVWSSQLMLARYEIRGIVC